MQRIVLTAVFITGTCVTSLQSADQPTAVAIETKVGERREMKLDPQGSLARLGSNTVCSLQGTDLKLDQGLVLISTGQGKWRRSEVEVSLPKGQVSVRGTLLVSVAADGTVKLTCLEGQASAKWEGHKISVPAGQFMQASPLGTPLKAEIDLATLAGTCALLGKDFAALPVQAKIAREVQQQEKKSLVAQQKQTKGQAETISREFVPHREALASASASEPVMASVTSGAGTFAMSSGTQVVQGSASMEGFSPVGTLGGGFSSGSSSSSTSSWTGGAVIRLGGNNPNPVFTGGSTLNLLSW